MLLTSTSSPFKKKNEKYKWCAGAPTVSQKYSETFGCFLIFHYLCRQINISTRS